MFASPYLSPSAANAAAGLQHNASVASVTDILPGLVTLWWSYCGKIGAVDRAGCVHSTVCVLVADDDHGDWRTTLCVLLCARSYMQHYMCVCERGKHVAHSNTGY